MKNKLSFITIVLLISTIKSIAQAPGTFTDARDGKVYKTVTIGTQTWLAENLAFKAASDCWAYDNSQNNVEVYGYLYTWKAAQDACPTGWHLPSDAEWKILVDYLGGMGSAGYKLKETDISHWLSPNEGATNQSGFTALPGGFSTGDGKFYYIGKQGYWWSSTMYDSYNAYIRHAEYANGMILQLNYSTLDAFSVRCVKD